MVAATLMHLAHLLPTTSLASATTVSRVMANAVLSPTRVPLTTPMIVHLWLSASILDGAGTTAHAKTVTLDRVWSVKRLILV